MFKRWFCLMLVLVMSLASFSLAEDEDIALEEPAIMEAEEDELVVDELPDDLELDALEDLALDLSVEDQGLLELAEPEGGEEDSTVNEADPDNPKLTLNYKKLLIGVKEKTTILKATRSPADNTDTVTWTSSRSSVVKVNKKSGKITGVKAGTATITAKTASGLKAKCKVTVKKAPRSVTVSPDNLTLSVGETFKLTGTLPSGKGSTLTYTSSDKTVAKVGKRTGVVTAVAAGSATITVSTFNKKKATCEVTVIDGPAQVFLPETLTVLLHTSATVTATAVDENGEEVPATFTYKGKSGTGKISVGSKSGKVTGKAVGTATLRVTAQNGVSTHLQDGKPVTTVCKVNVVEAPDRVELADRKITIDAGESYDLEPRVLAEDGSEIAGKPYTISVSDDSVLSVSEEGVVTGLKGGTAVVTVTATGGAEQSCTVTVVEANPVEYRLFAAYSYHDSLPFVKRNSESMAKVFKKSNIGGQTYSTKVLGNASKSRILSGISNFFDDADDNDVSIVYFCSHGHNNKSSYSSYRLSLKGYDSNKNNSKYYLTSKEIFNSIQAINGNVILILDSCYSGTFINDMKSRLADEDGRIAVLTAASNTRATFYNVKSKSVDFFTYFLLQGLGYNEKESWWNKNSSGDKGSYPGYFSADRKGDDDGAATLGEFYNFASNCIAANIPNYMKKSWYWGDKSKVQKTRFYAGSLKNLVIYQPE